MTTGIIPGLELPGTGQSAEDGWSEFEDTRTIEEDLQSGTISHAWIVPGRPDEAYRNQHIGGLDIAKVHPFYRHSYLVKRRFQNYVVRGQEENRRTMITAGYRTRPCPHYPELSSTMSLASVNTWWSYDDPPVPIDSSTAGFPVLQPQATITMRWPYIDLSLDYLISLRGLGGRLLQKWDTATGADERLFFGERCKDLLFDGLQEKLLFGPGGSVPGNNSRWELSLHFHLDWLRHHQRWVAEFDNSRDASEEEPNGYDGTGGLMPVTSLTELLQGVGHKKQTMHIAVEDGSEWNWSFGFLVGRAEEAADHGECTSEELNQIGPVL